MIKTVLVFVIQQEKLLMIYKKRGQGQGFYNVPGGKCLSGESPYQAALRECREESGLLPKNLKECGKLDFYFEKEAKQWDNQATVFVSYDFEGELIPEGEECRALWVPLKDIPYDCMWPADRYWVPLVLAGKRFHHVYKFDKNQQVTHSEIVF